MVTFIPIIPAFLQCSHLSAMFHDCWQHWNYYPGFLASSYHALSNSKDCGRIMSFTLTTPPPGPLTVVFINLKPFAALLWSFLCKFCAFCMNGMPTQSEFVSAHFELFCIAELPSHIVMSVPASRRDNHHLYTCGCNRLVFQSTEWHHKHHHCSLPAQPKSPPPLKRHYIVHFQVESPIITPDDHP